MTEKNRRPHTDREPVVDGSFRNRNLSGQADNGTAVRKRFYSPDPEAYQDPLYTEPLIPGYLRDQGIVNKRWVNICRRMEKILGPGYFDEASAADMDETLFMMEQMCLTFRQELADRLELDGAAPPKKATDPKKVKLTDPPVTVRMDGGALILSSPATLIRSSTHSWYLARMAVHALREFEKQHGPVREQIQKPVYIVVKRKDTEFRRGYRDNENLETSKMINEIFRFLRFSDRPTNAGYVSVFELVESKDDAGTQIILFSKDHLRDCWRYLLF